MKALEDIIDDKNWITLLAKNVLGFNSLWEKIFDYKNYITSWNRIYLTAWDWEKYIRVINILVIK